MSRKRKGKIRDVSMLNVGPVGAGFDLHDRINTPRHEPLPKPVDTIQLPSGLQVPASTTFLGGDFPLSPAPGVAAVSEPEYVTYEVHCPRCRQLWYRLLQIRTAEQGGAVCGTCRGVLSLRRHATSTQGLNSGFDVESRRKRTDEHRG